MASDGEIGFFCQNGEHENCAHKIGSVVTLLSKSKSYDLLCTCSCHRACPLGGKKQAPEPAWFDTCTYPASEPWRENIRLGRAKRDAEQQKQKEVFASIDLGRGRSASELQAMILAEYERRGWEPPDDYAWVARFLAASTAHRARGLRLLTETARGLNAARKWLKETGTRNDPDDEE